MVREGRERRGSEKGLRLAGAMSYFWLSQSHLREGRRRLAAVLSHRERPAAAGRDAGGGNAWGGAAGVGGGGLCGGWGDV